MGEYGESGPATLAKISEMMFNLLHQSQDRLQMQFEEERSRHVLLIEEQKKQLDMQELVIKEMEVERTKLFRTNVLLKKQIGEISSLGGNSKKGAGEGEEMMELCDANSQDGVEKETEKQPQQKKKDKEREKEKDKEREKEKDKEGEKEKEKEKEKDKQKEKEREQQKERDKENQK